MYSAESWRVFGCQSWGVPPSPPSPGLWRSMPTRRGSIPASSMALDAMAAASSPSSFPPGRDGASAPGLVRFLSALMHHLAVSGNGPESFRLCVSV